MASFFGIMIASVGFGAGAEAMRRYRGFKATRRARPYDERNAGFWTDRKIYQAEYAFMAIWLGAPWLMIVLAVQTNGRLEWTYLTMLGYPLGIYILLAGLNAPLINSRTSRKAGRTPTTQGD